MSSIFCGASSFNQSLQRWNVSIVTLHGWNVSMGSILQPRIEWVECLQGDSDEWHVFTGKVIQSRFEWLGCFECDQYEIYVSSLSIRSWFGICPMCKICMACLIRSLTLSIHRSYATRWKRRQVWLSTQLLLLPSQVWIGFYSFLFYFIVFFSFVISAICSRTKPIGKCGLASVTT